MLRKIFPVILALIGIGAGVGAGVALKAPPEEVTDAHSCGPESASEGELAEVPDDPEKPTEFDYVKLNNQFVIPVVDEARVSALVVLSLSLEIAAGSTELVYEREPKLRDAFLQVLFDHANAGGFDGAFTNSNSMLILRDSLREIATKTLGPKLHDVLIIDIVRQDT